MQTQEGSKSGGQWPGSREIAVGSVLTLTLSPAFHGKVPLQTVGVAPPAALGSSLEANSGGLYSL